MEILKSGVIHDPGKDTFDGKCAKCGAIIRFTRNEGTTALGGQPADPVSYIWYYCPTKKCGQKICVDLDAANKKMEGF